MHHYFQALTNAKGDSLVGYFARLIDPVTGSVVTLASDANGTPISTVSGVTNMATTDGAGNLSFYVAAGTYHLDIYDTDATTFVVRVASVPMGDSRGFGADITGTVDCTALFQIAINAGNVTFPGPGNYTMSYTAINADVTIPANRKITVEKGATITMTGGRFVAENVDNVEWQIDGWVKSVAMRTAASKTAWTASTGERGFIEFGSDYSAGTARSGFKVHGSGKVSGDWTGTPNYSDPTAQINRKGIACWNAKNVFVGLSGDVFGFDGEAIYASFFDTASHNIVFAFNNVHDTRFNALNFNAGANGGGCRIIYNRAVNTYGIEASTGEVDYNDFDTTPGSGIRGGVGAGYGPLSYSYNTVRNAGTHGIEAAFASGSPVSGVSIIGNDLGASAQSSIYTDYADDLVVKGNHSAGAGTVAGGYDISINHAHRGIVSGNDFMAPGGFAQAGRVSVLTSFDVSVDPDTNVYIPTTGTAGPMVGNGVVSVASAATLTLPPLGSKFLMTGATTITSIVATNNNGREVTLINAALTDGSNLKLNGSLAAAATTTVRLLCDGTNWLEVSRSVN